MAIRNIRTRGDEVLNKTSKPVEKMTHRIKTLINDMLDTMYDAQGVGLAAPQVGVLRRVVVIDVSEEADSPIIMINPKILETDGEQRGSEGCLSIPGKVGIVTRPQYVKAEALNEDMERFEIEGRDLLARAIVHEIEHLDGHLYVEKAEDGKLYNVDEFNEEDHEQESE